MKTYASLPLALTTKEVISTLKSRRLFLRALTAGWIKPHIRGDRGRTSIFKGEDVQSLWIRLGREQPPLLPYERKSISAFSLPELMGCIAIITILAGTLIPSMALNRCASTEIACKREAQTLNSAYQSYVAAGGNPLPATATTEEAYNAVKQPVNGVGPFLVREGARPVFALCSGVNGPEWSEKGFVVPTPAPEPTSTPAATATPTPTATPAPTPTATPLQPLTVSINATNTVDQGGSLTISADISNPNPEPAEAELSVAIPPSFQVGELADGWTYDGAGPSLVYRNSIPSGDFTSPPVSVKPLSPAGDYTLTATLDGNFAQANVSAPVVVTEAFQAISVDTTASPQSIPYGGSGVLNVSISNPNPSSYVTLDIALPSGPVAVTHQGQWLHYAGSSAPASDVPTNSTYNGPAAYLFSGTLSLPSGWSLVEVGRSPGIAITAGFDEFGQLVDSYNAFPTAQTTPIYNLRFEGALSAGGTTSVALPYTGNAIGSHSITASSSYAGVTCPDGTQTVVAVVTTSAVVNVQAPVVSTPTPTPAPTPTPVPTPSITSSGTSPAQPFANSNFTYTINMRNSAASPLVANFSVTLPTAFSCSGVTGTGWNYSGRTLTYTGTLAAGATTTGQFTLRSGTTGLFGIPSSGASGTLIGIRVR